MKLKNILWDFDGVILNSMAIRDLGFQEIFKSFPKEKVHLLLNYHRINGGLSRYVKIRYFFEKILGEDISNEKVLEYAENFSKIMKDRLTDSSNLINDSLDFIKQNYKKYNFHIVSGSDHKELNFLSSKLDLSKYFISIQGSPTPKNQLVSDLLSKYNYKCNDTCLIGDSVNDFEAAQINNILFFGYNNIDLKDLGENYISSFKVDSISL